MGFSRKVVLMRGELCDNVPYIKVRKLVPKVAAKILTIDMVG